MSVKGVHFPHFGLADAVRRRKAVVTTNKAFKTRPSIFNNDSTVTSAILDRLLHHSETITIHGKSYRTRDAIDPQ